MVAGKGKDGLGDGNGLVAVELEFAGEEGDVAGGDGVAKTALGEVHGGGKGD